MSDNIFDIDMQDDEVKQEENNEVVVDQKSQSEDVKVVVAQDSGLEIKLPEMDSHAGMQSVVLGQRISRVPIERYKGTTIKNDRIALITRDGIALKTHYIDNVGSIVCFTTKEKTGKCCTIAGMPGVRYLFPIVLYSTDNEGNVVSSKVELRMLSAGEDLYKSIIVADRASGGKLDKFDILVTCTDDKYQKLTLNAAGPAQWLKSEKIVNNIVSQWNNNKESAYMAVARLMDEATFMDAISEGGYQDSGGHQPTFNESNTDLNSFFGEGS